MANLLTHPLVLLGELDDATADQVDQLLLQANAFDAMAGHLIHAAWQCGWQVLTADPGRLRRIDPALDIDLF